MDNIKAGDDINKFSGDRLGRKNFSTEGGPIRSTIVSPPVPEPGPRRPGLKEEIVLVFSSTTMVLNAEDLLEERDLVFELIPVPKAVNPNCGLAVCFDDQARPEIMRALAEAALRPSAAYIRRGEEFEPWGDRPFPAAAPKPS